jgi:hypothetical protein
MTTSACASTPVHRNAPNVELADSVLCLRPNSPSAHHYPPSKHMAMRHIIWGKDTSASTTNSGSVTAASLLWPGALLQPWTQLERPERGADSAEWLNNPVLIHDSRGDANSGGSLG